MNYKFYSPALILCTFVINFSCHALAADPARAERLRPLVGTGIISEDGATMAREFGARAYETLVEAADAMMIVLHEAHLTSVDESVGRPAVAHAPRAAAREVMRARLYPGTGPELNARIDETLDHLRDFCGMLIVPRAALTSLNETPALSTN